MQINQQLGNMFRNGLLKIKETVQHYFFFSLFLSLFLLFHFFILNISCALLARVLKTPGSRSKEWTYCILHSR